MLIWYVILDSIADYETSKNVIFSDFFPVLKS